MSDALTPTPASAWRRGVLLKLPYSGFVVRVRALDITQVLREESLHNPFLSALNPMLVNLLGSISGEDKEIDPRHPVAQLRELYEKVAALAVVEPKVVLKDADPDKNEVNAADWQFEDLQFVYATLGRPLNELERFSQDPAAYLEFVQSINGVSYETERDDEYQRDDSALSE